MRPRPHLLPPRPRLDVDVLGRVVRDHDRFARDGLPNSLPDYLAEAYQLDVRARYAGLSLPNPWGKGSGQLSLQTAQVADAVQAELGLVVLKTVIAQDARGVRSMGAWAERESRMVVERITGRESGESGWTVTWKGRGWWDTFEAYLELVREAVAVGRGAGKVVVPSVKYHLPGPGETDWRLEEYMYTTRHILDAYDASGAPRPMPIEFDFSPTLAGSDRSAARETVMGWLGTVSRLVREAVEPGAVCVGVKVFNSLDDDAFQLAMLDRLHREGRPDFLVYANRLFDPDREFAGHRGVAYGGPDLSDRNLRVLSAFRRAQAAGASPVVPMETSATGDIHSGKMAVEYALRGCSSAQIHTLFQLPASEFAMGHGSKLARAIHRLYFDPDDGLIVWLLHAGQRLGLERDGQVRWLDVTEAGGKSHLQAVDLDA